MLKTLLHSVFNTTKINALQPYSCCSIPLLTKQKQQVRFKNLSVESFNFLLIVSFKFQDGIQPFHCIIFIFAITSPIKIAIKTISFQSLLPALYLPSKSDKSEFLFCSISRAFSAFELTFLSILACVSISFPMSWACNIILSSYPITRSSISSISASFWSNRARQSRSKSVRSLSFSSSYTICICFGCIGSPSLLL